MENVYLNQDYSNFDEWIRWYYADMPIVAERLIELRNGLLKPNPESLILSESVEDRLCTEIN